MVDEALDGISEEHVVETFIYNSKKLFSVGESSQPGPNWKD